MRKFLKARKNIAGIRYAVNAGELVSGIRTGTSYTIYPLDRNDISIAGVPAHYLEEVEQVSCPG